MDVSDIELIKTVASVGSLSEASKRLNLSQPTLSRKLLRLEDEIGAKLFHRSTKGLQTTRIADYIIAEYKPLRTQLNAIKRYVELATQMQTGRITVGVGPIIEQILLPDVLAHFIEQTGDVQVSVVTEDEPTLLALFEAGELDVVIGPINQDMRDRKRYLAFPMIREEIVAVARPSHPVFDHETLTGALLAEYPLVIPKTHGAIIAGDGAPRLPVPKLAFDNYDLLKKLTQSRDLICAGPKSVFRPELTDQSLRIIEWDLKTVWESTLLVRPVVYSTPLIQHFVELCQAVANPKG